MTNFMPYTTTTVSTSGVSVPSWVQSYTSMEPTVIEPRWPHGMTAVVEAFDDLHAACRMLKEAWE